MSSYLFLQIVRKPKRWIHERKSTSMTLRICVPKKDGILTNYEVNNHKWMEVYVKIVSHAHSDSPTVQLLSMKRMMSLLSEGNSDASCLLSTA